MGINRTLWVPKWLAGFSPLGKVLQRNLQQDHAECPRCAAFETTGHGVKCQAPKAQRQWDSSITKLDAWLLKAMTLPDLNRAILQRLKSWRNNNDRTEPSFRWPGINDIVRQQDRVGWRAFFEGAVLQSWAAKQQEYYTWLKRKNTGKRWIVMLIKKLWEISWNMWEQQNGELQNPESPATIQEHNRLDAAITIEYVEHMFKLYDSNSWKVFVMVV